MKTKTAYFLISLILMGNLLPPLGSSVGMQHMANESPQVALFSHNMGYIGQIGGGNMAVAIQGNYAYVGAGLRMVILDISDPTAPVEIGRTAPMPDVVMDIAVSGSYAYIADDSVGLRIFNVANHADPFLVGSLPESATSVAVAGNYAYLGGGGLRIVNIAHPEAPYKVSYLDLPWEFSNLAVREGYVYAAGGESLKIVNVADPAAPFLASDYIPYQYASVNDLALVGDFAYLATGYTGYDVSEGLYIVDIRNPTAPFQAGHYYPYYLGTSFTNVAVSGNYAYLTSTFDGRLAIVNVTHPDGPYEVGNFDIANPNGIAVADGFAFITSRSGLQIVDVAKPSAPFAAGHYDIPSPASVAVAGGYAYVTNGYGLRIFDIADPNSLSGVGYIDTPGDAQNVAVDGNYAYIADDYFGLLIVDVSDPTAPNEVGFYDTPGNATDVAVANGYAYVADGRWGLRIVDVSDPTAPFEVGNYPLQDNSKVVVVGDYAFVIDENTLRILNVNDPTSPFDFGNYEFPHIGQDVAVAGDYAYIADQYGLRIVNVSDPVTPIEVGYYDANYLSNGYTFAVAVAGSYAYLITNYYFNKGMQVVNIADPTAPFEVGYYYYYGDYWNTDLEHSGFLDVAVAGGNAYIAGEEWGLFILRYTRELDFDTKIALPLSLK